MMRRLKKRHFSFPSVPTWLIIFTDMTTLMLTFFIILTAISVVSDQNRQQAVASVRGAFGQSEKPLWNEQALEGAVGKVIAHPSGPRPPSGFAPGESRLFADNPVIAVRHTETEMIISLPEDVLFSEGGAELGTEGRQALDRVVPFLQRLTHPVLIAGYSSAGFGEGTRPRSIDARTVDFSWALSLDRALAVYQYFNARGTDPAMLRTEGYGRYRPRADNQTPEGRRQNRRIELVIDRRNPGVQSLPGLRIPADQEREYHFRDFQFNLELPDGNRTVQQRGS